MNVLKKSIKSGFLWGGFAFVSLSFLQILNSEVITEAGSKVIVLHLTHTLGIVFISLIVALVAIIYTAYGEWRYQG